MPGLDFHPEYERHTTFAAVLHCPRHYAYLRETAGGARAAVPIGESLLVGIGMDEGIAAFWRNGGDVQAGIVAADRAVHDPSQVLAGEVSAAEVGAEVELGVRQYAAQWAGIRDWSQGTVHGYVDDPRAYVLPEYNFLAMPDIWLRDSVGKQITVIDCKTGKYAYDPLLWAFEPQLLSYCYAFRRWFPGYEIQFLIDYMQRPSKSKRPSRSGRGEASGWTFPVTYPFSFDAEREALAQSWLRRAHACTHPPADQADPWPRDPGACRTWHGLCEFWPVCFGQQP